VEKAIVKFTRQDGQVGATGVTDKDGKFTLTTYQAGDGVPEGDYVISIMKVETPKRHEGSGNVDSPDYVPPPETPEDALPPAEKHLLPKKYGNPAQSGLTHTVKSGGPNEPKFELKD
jgi:hypothetical protein